MNAESGGRAMPGLAAPWVDRLLLAGPDREPCLRLGQALDRTLVRAGVAEAEDRLRAAGLAPGGSAALRLPPSLAFVTSLLAAWRIGAQVSLLDHRLTEAEVGRALDRLAPQLLIEPEQQANTAMRGYSVVAGPRLVARPEGRPAETDHVLIQLSSGSTGPSKVIARTAADLEFELDRYAVLDGFPRRGGRVVLLSSIVHVLGLVGGLLHGLHAGVELVLPERLTAAGILAAVDAGAEAGEPPRPTTVIGVPFYAELLAAAAAPRTLALERMIVAGELTRPGVPEAFTAAYGVPLGSMYGMTELGVIATDLDGTARPALDPNKGLELRIEDGELHIRRPESPYLGASDPARWSEGWLHTRDAARIDPATGRVTILGRRDSQVSIGGLKVDLTEVEQALAATPGVTGAIVVFDDGAILAYLTCADGVELEDVRRQLAAELASYKLPRRLVPLAELPRTATGKLLRDVAALRTCAQPPTRPAPAG
ncbi:class I adenylate-forming enzyme family protein [Actinospica robiniae]|uniref:class I adenylate-forming enzyme family protein n=1 Tax=Actinospica robiniae TaxID=304901 RepID=UPI003CCBEFC2